MTHHQMCTCGAKFQAATVDGVWALMDAHALLDHPAKKPPPIGDPEHASSWPSTIYKRGQS